MKKLILMLMVGLGLILTTPLEGVSQTQGRTYERDGMRITEYYRKDGTMYYVVRPALRKKKV